MINVNVLGGKTFCDDRYNFWWRNQWRYFNNNRVCVETFKLIRWSYFNKVVASTCQCSVNVWDELSCLVRNALKLENKLKKNLNEHLHISFSLILKLFNTSKAKMLEGVKIKVRSSEVRYTNLFLICIYCSFCKKNQSVMLMKKNYLKVYRIIMFYIASICLSISLKKCLIKHVIIQVLITLWQKGRFHFPTTAFFKK